MSQVSSATRRGYGDQRVEPEEDARRAGHGRGLRLGQELLPPDGGHLPGAWATIRVAILRRHELRATIMTSNRPIEDWGKLIGDVPSATAILDRFLHHAEVIQTTGRSYRLRDRAGAATPARTDREPCKDA